MLDAAEAMAISVSDGRGGVAREDQLRNLFSDLRQVRGLKMEPVVRAEAPGTKGADGSWAEILIAMGAAGALLPTAVSVLKDWLLRQPPSTAIRIKTPDFELEVSGAFTSEQLSVALSKLLKTMES